MSKKEEEIGKKKQRKSELVEAPLVLPKVNQVGQKGLWDHFPKPILSPTLMTKYFLTSHGYPHNGTKGTRLY